MLYRMGPEQARLLALPAPRDYGLLAKLYSAYVALWSESGTSRPAAPFEGQRHLREVIWQACECPEPDVGAGECDDLVADEDGGGKVQRAIDTFETERLRAKDSDHSLQ